MKRIKVTSTAGEAYEVVLPETMADAYACDIDQWVRKNLALVKSYEVVVEDKPVKGIYVTVSRVRMEKWNNPEVYTDTLVYIGKNRTEKAIKASLQKAIAHHLMGENGDRDLSYASGDYNWGDGMSNVDAASLQMFGFIADNTPIESDGVPIDISVNQDEWPCEGLDCDAVLVVQHADGSMNRYNEAVVSVEMRSGAVDLDYSQFDPAKAKADDKVFIEFKANDAVLHPVRCDGTAFDETARYFEN